MTPWIAIATAVVGDLPSLILAITALFRRFPQLTPEMLTTEVLSACASADTAFAAAIAKIAADQAAHPAAP
jgi:hypothetical protein